MPYVSLVLLLLLSQTALAQADTQQASAAADSIYTVVEKMPVYRADCPEGGNAKPCADKAMMEFVYGNLNYPTEAKAEGKEGVAVVTFVVEKDGRINQAAINRDPGYGMGEEALRVVQSMNDDGPSWRPATMDEQPVRAKFNLAVNFSQDK